MLAIKILVLSASFLHHANFILCFLWLQEGNDDVRERMQVLALAEESLLLHLKNSLFTQSIDNRLLAHRFWRL
jgi:hypothetical protein